jgi:hypothetical protein
LGDGSNERRAGGGVPVGEVMGAIAEVLKSTLQMLGLTIGTERGSGVDDKVRSHRAPRRLSCGLTDERHALWLAQRASPEELTEVFVDFRSRVRSLALGKAGAGIEREILRLCDEFRLVHSSLSLIPGAA